MGILWLGAYQVMDGAMTIGALIAFNMLAGRVAQPVLRLAQLWQELQQTGIAVARLGDILNTRPEAQPTARAQLPPIQGRIEFDQVHFRYRPDAAKLAGAHEFILALPEGYDTLVGEQGATLSGGQRQRIAIARALMTHPRILIFDEATSALDYESEKVIHDNMRAIAQGRTVIFIAHRLSSVRDAHRIMVLDHGQIAEEGTHAELIKKPLGRYARRNALQAG